MECDNRIESNRLQQQIDGLMSLKLVQDQKQRAMDGKLAEMKAFIQRSKETLNYDV